MTSSVASSVRFAWIPALLLMFALGQAASAQNYTVTLNNGSQFQTQYQPKEASWDRKMVLLLSDAGNWVALPRTDIQSISEQLQEQGGGTYLDKLTVRIGYSFNDAPTEKELEAQEPGSQIEALAQYLQQTQAPPAQDFSVQQFVDPGGAGGGLPASFGAATGAPPGNVVLFGNNP